MENTKIKIEDLDAKSVICVLKYYNELPESFKKNIFFSKFVEKCVVKMDGGDKHFCQYGVKYNPRYDKTDLENYFGIRKTSEEAEESRGVTVFEHPFYFLFESEENAIKEIFKKA